MWIVIIFLDCVQHIVLVLLAYFNWWLKQARSKTRKTRKFFSQTFKSDFSILAVGQNWKLGNKKTRNNISEISEISELSEFSICHFFIFQKTFLFNILQWAIPYFLSMLCFDFKAFLKCFFLHQKYMFKTFPCRNEIYLLWDVSTLVRTWDKLIWNSMKSFNLSHA